MPRTFATSVKLSDETRSRLEALAQQRQRSAHWIMRAAIEQYLDREEAAEEFRTAAVTAWENYQRTGLHVTSQEANDWLAKLAAGEEADPPKCHP